MSDSMLLVSAPYNDQIHVIKRLGDTRKGLQKKRQVFFSRKATGVNQRISPGSKAKIRA